MVGWRPGECEYSRSVRANADILLTGDQTPAPEAGERPLDGGVLGFAADAVAVPVPLDLVDIGCDVEGCRSLPGALVAFYDAQAFALYPAKPLRHWPLRLSVPQERMCPLE
jgi:hypothetical protein